MRTVFSQPVSTTGRTFRMVSRKASAEGPKSISLCQSCLAWRQAADELSSTESHTTPSKSKQKTCSLGSAETARQIAATGLELHPIRRFASCLRPIPHPVLEAPERIHRLRPIDMSRNNAVPTAGAEVNCEELTGECGRGQSRHVNSCGDDDPGAASKRSNFGKDKMGA